MTKNSGRRATRPARPASALATAILLAFAVSHAPAAAQDDPVVRRIVELGTTDNQVMVWADYATNRFGGRLTGSDAYTNAAQWAAWQFRQWGIRSELDEVGEVPVGFNRGPWFGRMVAPAEKSLYFGTPSFTAGTRGVQRGRVTILRADPFSVPGRNPTPEDIARKSAAVEAAIAEVTADPARFDGAWVLIAGDNTGFARDGRRNTPEYSDATLIPPLTRALLQAGALGTIQRSGDPIRILDGYVDSWDELPELPDVKLLHTQYDDVRSLVERGEPVELEFDIRNWFRMGPVRYHNIVAVIPGSTHPDEYVVIGGHFDSFDGATGAVDNGSGASPVMEAMRLIQKAGGAPKRTIVAVLFAAEEIGLVGSQVWLRRNPDLHSKIVVMINRDASPGAINGASVPASWLKGFEQVTAPLASVDARWPFALSQNSYPSARPDRPGGSDHASFAMLGIPVIGLRNQTDYVYGRAWHTLYDLYSELVPYTDHQKHSALAMAVVAWGIANLDHTLPREGFFLEDGLYADITTASGARVMASLDYANVPLQAAYFVRMFEGGAPAAGPGGAGGRQASTGRILGVANGVARARIESDRQKSVAVPDLPLVPNPAVTHDGPGVLGLSGADGFYLTVGARAEPGPNVTPLGRVVAGAHRLGDLAAGDEIRSITIIRAGDAARAFATDDEAFRRLREAAARSR
jgi:carboxypeptidase Q